MCRFTFYKGQLIAIGDVLIEPEYALLSQSRNANYHPGIIFIISFNMCLEKHT